MLGLPQEQRLCVVLRYAHGLSVPHVAHVLNVADDQVQIALDNAQGNLDLFLYDAAGTQITATSRSSTATKASPRAA